MQKYDNDMIVNTLYDMYLSIEDYDINPEIIKKRQKALKRVIAMYATPDEFNYLFPSKQMKKIMENLWSDLTDEVCPERLKVLLENTRLEIHFVKKGGEDRMIECTLSPYFLKNESVKVPVQNKTNSIIVYDCENGGFRRILYGSIYSVSFSQQ